MWTGDGRVFFYNPSSRTSVWERPEDLLGRADVDKMVATPPDALAKEKESAPVVVKQQTQPPSSKRSGSEDSESETEETPAKKMKKEETPGKAVYFCQFLWFNKNDTKI